ncbi:leucine-rich repeat flightless-interacting protein 2-like isoform X1 [Liolophura sinensis]|uniref:leucine-rich repeat flightless-interacting protein 2-like isoform X1 n=1 Tax=Liolophura sinensis TaxID=3198878 RepID=UPI00315986AB
MSSATERAGRRRQTARTHTAEDQALNQIAKEAESRLAAKRAERAQAREIRMKELERLQKETEEKTDRVYEITNTDYSRVGKSRSVKDDNVDETRDLKSQVYELEEKFKKAMMNTALLDNEKQALLYQVDLLKDKLDDQEEQLMELQREHKDKCRQFEAHKRKFADLERDFNCVKELLAQRDKLIQDHGLVIVGSESGELTLAKNPDANGPVVQLGAALVSPEAAKILEEAGEGSLGVILKTRKKGYGKVKVEGCGMDKVDGRSLGTNDDRLKKFAEEKLRLEDQVKKLKEELEEERAKSQLSEKFSHTPSVAQINGPEMQLYEVQREASKQIHEYKLKLQKAEQDIATLEGSVSRLDTQVKRYRQSAEASEKMEDEMKQEKRKMQREMREAQNQIEELQNRNLHLQKRMERLKQDRLAAIVGQ